MALDGSFGDRKDYRETHLQEPILCHLKLPEMLEISQSRVLEDNLTRVEICFLLDCTGSMQRLLSTVQDKIHEVVARIQSLNPGNVIRLAVIVYRDVLTSVAHEILQFTSVNNFFAFLSQISAIDGDDDAEDVVGGLFCVLQQLHWHAATRLLMHFCDSPSHGRFYHGPEVSDRYMGFDCDGTLGRSAMEGFVAQHINYFLFSLRPEKTSKMAQRLKEFYDAHPGRCTTMTTIPVLQSNLDSLFSDMMTNSVTVAIQSTRKNFIALHSSTPH